MNYLKKESVDINKELQDWTTDEWQEYYESNTQLPSDTYDGEIWEED
jgi:hypothetical protein